MEKGNWIPIDKRAVFFLPKDRPYTPLEALYSLTVDVDNGKEGTLKGYASLWQWDRSKVRRFVKELSNGLQHYPDRKATQERHPIRFVFNNLHLRNNINSTGKQHSSNTTIDPNPISSKKGCKGYKGVSGVRPPPETRCPLSFEQYKKNFKPDNKEAVKVIDYFLSERKKLESTKGLRDHLPLKPEMWEEILSEILSAGDQDISFKDHEIIIPQYFKTEFQPGCDYSIVHFNSGSVKANRYYETVY
ncbi:MAG: hypothetical protein C0392_01050 [Syntrophus sp. (in: bacteria)]|nr:hypothetical protein [Syntrophus sp. (in: bacteria)]